MKYSVIKNLLIIIAGISLSYQVSAVTITNATSSEEYKFNNLVLTLPNEEGICAGDDTPRRLMDIRELNRNQTVQLLPSDPVSYSGPIEYICLFYDEKYPVGQEIAPKKIRFSADCEVKVYYSFDNRNTYKYHTINESCL